MTGIIVLDGPDCCGKTTLANDLIMNHGARYVHATYRFGKTMFAYHTAVMRKALHYRDWETDRKSTRLNSSHRL